MTAPSGRLLSAGVIASPFGGFGRGRSLDRSLRGEFSAAIEELLRQLIELRMLVEATLDFPEEELDALDRADAHERHARLVGAIETALTKSRQGSLLRTGLQVVLAGRPNVGKSSLLNRLAGEELAIVTAIPGTTRDSLRQAIHIDGVPLNIVDTAGLRDTQDEVERMGIARTWSEIGRADVVLLLVDARSGVTTQDLELCKVFRKAQNGCLFTIRSISPAPCRECGASGPRPASMSRPRPAPVWICCARSCLLSPAGGGRELVHGARAASHGAAPGGTACSPGR